ncbi:hypothetical protein [Halorubrum sp. SD626R]|uniref:hypothetical protein n=1 Tax=Halorubrum sp. SD626R TaxID=1419722 RepID=UPI000AE40C04|nr:hypothetical protein [Halorubrum sp. SD626R]TKX80270.1 hypothetical protein EXE53_11880 [Halorubrum sp. SD626R]
MKGIGATAVATVGLSHDRGFAQNAEAIAPLVAGAVVAGSVGVGWALREFEVIGSDAPAEGLTSSALEQQIYQAVKTRRSNNKSTIVDNGNILDGVEHTAYTDAKVAAIEELNAGSSESDVLSAANTAIDTYESSVKGNFLKSWNESVNELQTLLQSLDDHPDLSRGAVLNSYDISQEQRSQSLSVSDVSNTLPDGTDLPVKEISIHWYDDWQATISPFTATEHVPNQIQEGKKAVHLGLSQVDGDFIYLDGAEWKPLYNEMDTTFQNVRDGISTWVTNVYGDVQSGSIEIDDLVTPRERAAMMSEEEGMSQAIADLIALNVPVDSEREATITIDDTGATLRGTFALTDPSDGPIESGTTYDPSTFSGDAYFTTDMSLVEGDWSEIETSVDGGTITITAEPYESTAIEVTTAASETVSVPAGDWTDNGDGTWSYDASGDLETPITNVDSARFHATTTETQYETLQLQGSFTVDKLVNKQSGEEVSTTSFSNSEPQSDSNYITQEEWDDLEQQNQELIEKYEDSQSNGGGLDLSGLDMFGLPGEIIAVVVVAIVGFVATSN